MSNIEALIRDASPRTEHDPDIIRAALAVSEEAASLARPRRGPAVAGVVLAAALTVSGGAIAVASAQTLWWTAPNEVTYELDLAPESAEPFRSVSYIPMAGYADGVDAETAGAEAAFHLAQNWLIEHAFTADVPQDSQVITDADRAARPEASNTVLLQDKAQRATMDQLLADAAAQSTEVEAALKAYLADQGIEEGVIVVDFAHGAFEVLR